MRSHVTSTRVALAHGRGYPVHFRSLDTVPLLMKEANLRRGRCLIITDPNVAAHYESSLVQSLQDAGWEPKVHVVDAGEASKSYAPLHAIYDDALSWGIDRKTPILALGGGVVGDLAGYAAATLLRGVPLVQIPTTLIAQVDSAIGGKTGINHEAGKNLIGAFHQPAFVCADLSTLFTLPPREWSSGLAETVKHALIADADLFGLLEARGEALLTRDADFLARMVPRAAAVKCRIVSQDELEHGVRAWLNFGHTFGHAIERMAGYGTFTHGEAVALGMRAALHLSHRLQPKLPFERLDALVRHIPVTGDLAAYDTDDLLAAMYSDKKVDAGALRLILLRNLGDAYVARDVATSLIRDAWTFIQQL